MPWTTDEIATALLGIKTPDVEAAAYLNAQMVDPEPGATADVMTLDVKKLLMLRLEYGAVKDASRDMARPAPVRAAALTLMAACEDPEIRTIGTSDPALMDRVKGMLAAFVSASIIAQSTMDDLLAMTLPRPVPRWHPAVNEYDVALARKS